MTRTTRIALTDRELDRIRIKAIRENTTAPELLARLAREYIRPGAKKDRNQETASAE